MSLQSQQNRGGRRPETIRWNRETETEFHETANMCSVCKMPTGLCECTPGMLREQAKVLRQSAAAYDARANKKVRAQRNKRSRWEGRVPGTHDTPVEQSSGDRLTAFSSGGAQ